MICLWEPEETAGRVKERGEVWVAGAVSIRQMQPGVGGAGRNTDHAGREEGISQPALPSPSVTSPPHPR